MRRRNPSGSQPSSVSGKPSGPASSPIHLSGCRSAHSSNVAQPDKASDLQEAVKAVLHECRCFVDALIFTSSKSKTRTTTSLRSAIQALMQLDSATFDVGALGYGHAVPLLLELIHAPRRTDSHALFRLVNDFAAWLRAHYLAEATHEREQPDSVRYAWPPNRVQMQLELLSKRERLVYEHIGDRPMNQQQIQHSLKKSCPTGLNDSTELYRTLGTLKKCLLIKDIANGYVRLTSTCPSSDH